MHECVYVIKTAVKSQEKEWMKSIHTARLVNVKACWTIQMLHFEAKYEECPLLQGESLHESVQTRQFCWEKWQYRLNLLPAGSAMVWFLPVAYHTMLFRYSNHASTPLRFCILLPREYTTLLKKFTHASCHSRLDSFLKPVCFSTDWIDKLA